MEHYLAVVSGTVWREERAEHVVREEWEERTGRERTGKCIQTIIARDLIFSSKCTKQLLRPSSARTHWGSLSASLGPLASVGSDKEHYLDAVGALSGEEGDGST
jgi:hypothetical protein